MGSKTASRGAGKRGGAKRGESTAPEKPVALTVKIDNELYVRRARFGLPSGERPKTSFSKRCWNTLIVREPSGTPVPATTND